jgi:hypothetical protein
MFPTSCKTLAGTLIAGAALLGAVPVAAQDNPGGETRAWHWIQADTDADALLYTPAQMLCVAPEAHRVIVFETFAPEGAARLAIVDNGAREVRDFRVGPVDAGASQRHFALFEADSGAEAGNVHMVNPGAYGDPADIYMPALSSVTIDGEWTDCLFDPGMRYMGYSDQSVVMVAEAEEGGLVLNRWRWGESDPETRLVGGRWTDDGHSLTVFLFPEEDAVWSVAGARGPSLDYAVWWVSNGDYRTESGQPDGYVLADMRQAGDEADRLPYALALHFERLDICRHLAGETSGNPERDAQVAESWARSGCDDLPANQRHYRAAYRSDRAISAALRLFDLDDLFGRAWPR